MRLMQAKGLVAVDAIESLVEPEERCECCLAPAGLKCQCEIIPLSGFDSETGLWDALYCTFHRGRV